MLAACCGGVGYARDARAVGVTSLRELCESDEDAASLEAQDQPANDVPVHMKCCQGSRSGHTARITRTWSFRESFKMIDFFIA